MRWTTVTHSAYSWEQEALDFIKQSLPPSSNIHAWSNFEFVADNGSIYEVDLLCVSPWGAFIIEIKSRRGVISGMGNLWSWAYEGHSKTAENPLLLANRKAKALATLLSRQKAFKNLRVPFFEALVFCSHESNKLLLSDPQRVCDRSTIIPALSRREAPGLRPFQHPPIDTPTLRATLTAVEQSGISNRPIQKTRRAGDYRLDRLFFDSPTGSYQDWVGCHATSKSGDKLIRIYLENQQSTEEERRTVRRAAEREYQILNRLDHPGVLHAETLTTTDLGHALVFKLPAGCRRLDEFLQENGDALAVGDRLDLLRDITESVAYAHRRKVVHRALSPQSILVSVGADGKRPRPLLFNFQVSLSRSESHTSAHTRVSRTLHAEQLIEDSSTVYLAPELVSGNELEGAELDIFSLGAIAYHLFSGRPPAARALDLADTLAANGGALDLRSVVNGVPEALAELVRFTANADRSLRFDAEDVLKTIDQIEEELTAPDQPPVADPREAAPGEELQHGLRVRRKLGSGSTAFVLLVEDVNNRALVLKLASKPENNARVRREFDLLRPLRHHHVVAVHNFFEFGEIHGFTMDLAGEKTLAQRLREDGRMEIEFLERFGDDLLQTIDFLDKEGIAHRDVKPDNLGVRSTANGPLRLVVFDFSLSASAPEDIQLGTPPYIDPFLSSRKVKRWDSYAERYAVAVTLYEMATGGSYPKWGGGDGKSDPQSVSTEAVIDSEQFPAELRSGMAKFFEKALRRDYRERFDNAEVMRGAWKEIFRNVDQPVVPPPTREKDAPPVSRGEVLAAASVGSQLILLGLSTRLVNALDRLGLVTVKDLLDYPLIKIQRMRGVGNKTRRELAELFYDLRRRFPGVRPDDVEEVRRAAQEQKEAGIDEAGASIDMLAKAILASASRMPAAERTVFDAYLGLSDAKKDEASGLAWIGQSDLATKLGVSRARVGQVITKARERWIKTSLFTRLRQTVADVIASKAGVVTHEELIAALLHLRGSALPDPERWRMASAVARVAVEAERELTEPRFLDYRRQGKIFVALRPDCAHFAQTLGKLADQLASEEPLPSSARVIERLQAEPAPVGLPAEVASFDAARLVQLAAAASFTACANARLELYPRGLDAARALKLSRAALFGSHELSIESLRERVASRYREAAPLPDRPELDSLLDSLGLSLRWSPAAQDGQGAYVPEHQSGDSISARSASLHRWPTRTASQARAQIPEHVAEAMRIEEKLRFAEKKGSFLVLATPMRKMGAAADEIERWFQVTRIDGDRLFLDALKAEAARLKVDWNVVLQADGGAAPRAWERLQALVGKAMPAIRETLLAAPHTILLEHPGLFARYGQLDWFQEVRTRVGTPAGPHGLWMIIPSHGAGAQPVLNGQAIPITNPAQFEILPEAWIANQHRP